MATAESFKAYGGIELLSLKEAQEGYKGLVQEELWLGLHNIKTPDKVENTLRPDDSIVVHRIKLADDHPVRREWAAKFEPGTIKRCVAPIGLREDEYLRKFATQHAAFRIAGPTALLPEDAQEYATQRETTRVAAASLVFSILGNVKDEFKREPGRPGVPSRKIHLLIELDIPEPVKREEPALFLFISMGWARSEDAQPVQPEQVQPAAVEVV